MRKLNLLHAVDVNIVASLQKYMISEGEFIHTVTVTTHDADGQKSGRSESEREEDFLNFFVNRSSNAPAKSLNSKIKCFRALLRGVSDVKFLPFCHGNLQMPPKGSYAKFRGWT